MFKEERFIHRIFHIDTNLRNSRSQLSTMNQIEQWNDNGVIIVEWAKVAQEEALIGLSHELQGKMLNYIYTEAFPNTPDNQKSIHQIQNILFPNGLKNKNQRNDVEIVFNAHTCGGILITNDGASKSQPGGILGHKEELKTLGITVMSDTDAVNFINDLVQQRDQRVINQCKQDREPIPEWVGKDNIVYI